MKNRNVILTAVVMICALGSAVASKLLIVNPIHVKGTLASTGAATCSTIAADCNNQGARNCEVRITLESGQTVSTNAYTNNTCNVLLKQSFATAIIDAPQLETVPTYVP